MNTSLEARAARRELLRRCAMVAAAGGVRSRDPAVSRMLLNLGAAYLVAAGDGMPARAGDRAAWDEWQKLAAFSRGLGL